jgi:RNA polymerase sigma factor for flagellar operon FliA
MPTLEVPRPTTEERRRKNQELASRYKTITPGSQAEEDLVREYLPLVRTIVGRLAMTLPAHVDIEDLYSSGLVGLLDAVRHYDPNGGSTFESYARVRIRGSVFDELRRLDWVPRSVHDKARRVQEVMNELEQKTGQVPSEKEMAEALELTPEEYQHLIEEIRPATFVSLDSVRSGDEESEAPRHEIVSDESQESPGEVAARRELARIIADRLEQLPEMQRKVLALYYFEDLRLREIAEVFGVTESRICQIHAQAILSIKSSLRKQEARA